MSGRKRAARKVNRSVWDGEAKCPYWRGETGPVGREILCDGLIGGQKLRMHFQTEKKRVEWMEKFCCTYAFGKCRLCRAIESEWAENTAEK